MKCIRCHKDCTYPERRATKECPHCKGKFAFEPREGDLFSDATFQASIDAVSGHGKLRWNYSHLYYEICRRKRPKRASIGLILVTSIISAVSLTLVAALFLNWAPVGPWVVLLWPVGAMLGLVALISLLSRLRSRTVRISDSKFDGMFRTWCLTHGVPEGLIPPPDRTKTAPQRTLEADVADYSFDRAVIVDRAETVEFLLANQFHFENNCAILSIDGYPVGPFETVRTMLKRNPELRVFLLHDASFHGCTISRKLLEDPAWFAEDPPRILDVGMRPIHAKDPFFDGLIINAWDRFEDEVPGVSAADAAWLRRYHLELAAIRPEQILKRLFMAMNRQEMEDRAAAGSMASASDGGLAVYPIFIPLGPTQEKPPEQNGGGGGGEVIFDDSSFGSGDATTVDAGGDSFG